MRNILEPPFLVIGVILVIVTTRAVESEPEGILGGVRAGRNF
jgi:hypothetical protein